MAGRFHAQFSSHGSLVYLWLKSRVRLVLSNWLVLSQSWHELAYVRSDVLVTCFKWIRVADQPLDQSDFRVALSR